MVIEVRNETASSLPEYDLLSANISVTHVYEVLERPEEPPTLLLKPLPKPAWLHYDQLSRPPSLWPTLWDTDGWRFIGIFADGQRAGCATIACGAKQLALRDGRSDVALLWDMRVAPQYRRRGLGTVLLRAVVSALKHEEVTKLKIRTQNTNVAACCLYARAGCRLVGAEPNSYRGDASELDLIWLLDL